MPGLVLEGGTFRPVFSCGVMDALLEQNIMFDYIVGVSAGITYAFSYISKQEKRNLTVLCNYRNDKRYLGMRNLISSRSVFGIDFVFDTIPNTLIPFDWDTYRTYEGKILVGATNARTGNIEYFDGMQLDSKNTMLRATCAIPFYFPAIPVNGTPYYDGGIADPIPIRKSLADGNRNNLIVLTRPKGYRKATSRTTRQAAHIMRRRYPQMEDTMLRRAKQYNESMLFCEGLAARDPVHTVLLRPAAPLSSFEKDVKKLEWGYEMGYTMACAHMDEIRRLF